MVEICNRLSLVCYSRPAHALSVAVCSVSSSWHCTVHRRISQLSDCWLPIHHTSTEGVVQLTFFSRHCAVYCVYNFVVVNMPVNTYSLQITLVTASFLCNNSTIHHCILMVITFLFAIRLISASYMDIPSNYWYILPRWSDFCNIWFAVLVLALVIGYSIKSVASLSCL